jgi:CRISPR system Cascade subunit CasA
MIPNDLLSDPVFAVTRRSGAVGHLSLPAILAGLADAGSTDPVEGFRHLIPHQRHGWHAFLVQVGVLALRTASPSGLPTDPDWWAAALLELGGQAPDAWRLVVEDHERPAFMQVRLPAGSPSPFKPKDASVHPDTLDLITTSKNHDVKQDRQAQPAPDHWVYALIAAQTMHGYPGPSWYGSVRMNGGYGSRTCVTFTPALEWGPWWRRDVLTALRQHDAVATTYGYPVTGGASLLWLLPWDGSEQLQLKDLDPFFIELSRRYRLTSRDGRLVLLLTGAAGRRISDGAKGEELRGVVGDPWMPYAKDGSKAFTPSSSGFPYEKMQQLLAQADWDLSPVARLQPGEDGPMWLVARALVRKQGGTDGYHERTLRVPATVVRLFGTAEGRDLFAERSKRYVVAAADTMKRVLAPAVATYCDEARLGKSAGDAFRGRVRREFDAAVDRVFFESLWAHIDSSDDDAIVAWTGELAAIARRCFEAALAQPVGATVHRLRARAQADIQFTRRVRALTRA